MIADVEHRLGEPLEIVFPTLARGQGRDSVGRVGERRVDLVADYLVDLEPEVLSARFGAGGVTGKTERIPIPSPRWTQS